MIVKNLTLNDKNGCFYNRHVPKILFCSQKHHNSKNILFLEMNFGEFSTDGFKWGCQN